MSRQDLRADQGYRKGSNGRKRQLQERVWELRLAGAPFQAIANEVGISKTYVQKLYKQSLEEYADRIIQTVDKYVAHQVEQYDRIILSHWPRRGDPNHAQIIMRAMDGKAKILGLNSPIRIDMKGNVEHTHESESERSTRLMRDAADEIARMTPEQLAAEAAALSGQ